MFPSLSPVFAKTKGVWDWSKALRTLARLSNRRCTKAAIAPNMLLNNTSSLNSDSCIFTYIYLLISNQTSRHNNTYRSFNFTYSSIHLLSHSWWLTLRQELIIYQCVHPFINHSFHAEIKVYLRSLILIHHSSLCPRINLKFLGGKSFYLKLDERGKCWWSISMRICWYLIVFVVFNILVIINNYNRRK